MAQNKRIRMFEIVQYQNYWEPKKALAWLDKVNCKYMAVLHDKDINEDGTPKGSHFHIVVKLKDARSIEDICLNCGVERQYIEFKNKIKDALAYLFHLTKKAREENKYEYDETSVIASKGVTYEEIKTTSENYDEELSHDNLIKELLYKYGSCEITKAELLNNISAKDYDRHGATFRRMKEFRIMKVREREMTVAYICGVSGSGKTTLAKFMANQMNYDFFVSGSGKDVLDGYDKEECIILDDLRADVFTKAELFKLTDNNTNSSVKSRFQNKDISYCKLMIITSIKTPHDLYNWDTSSIQDKDETFKQFSRRIGNKYLYINEDGTIIEKTYSIDNKIRASVLPFSMSNVFQVLGITKTLGADLMSKIYEKINNEVKKAQQNNEEVEDLPF